MANSSLHPIHTHFQASGSRRSREMPSRYMLKAGKLQRVQQGPTYSQLCRVQCTLLDGKMQGYCRARSTVSIWQMPV